MRNPSQNLSRDEAFARAIDVLDDVARQQAPVEQIAPPAPNPSNTTFERLDAPPTYATYAVDDITVLGAAAAFDSAMAAVAPAPPAPLAPPASAFDAALAESPRGNEGGGEHGDDDESEDAGVNFAREFDLGDINEALADLGAAPADNSVLRDYVEAASARTGFTLRKDPLEKARDWQIDFGPVSAPAGESTVIGISPQCDFRGEKITATDTAVPAGTGTRIVSIMIGQRVQRLASERSSTLTVFFAASALANGIKWDTCPRSLQIQVTVSFVKACTFDLTVFGKAVL